LTKLSYYPLDYSDLEHSTYTKRRNDTLESSAMGGHRVERMANITTTLPLPMLERIDELVQEGKVPSRSHVIREAVRNFLEDFE